MKPHVLKAGYFVTALSILCLIAAMDAIAASDTKAIPAEATEVSKGRVEENRTRRHDLQFQILGTGSKFHERALAKLFLDLQQNAIEILFAEGNRGCLRYFRRLGHERLLLNHSEPQAARTVRAWN